MSLILSLKKDMTLSGREWAGMSDGRVLFCTFPNISFVILKRVLLDFDSLILSQMWALFALSIREFTTCLCAQ